MQPSQSNDNLSGPRTQSGPSQQTRQSISVRWFVSLTAAVAAATVLGCADNAAGPNAPVSGAFAVVPNFGTLRPDIIEITKGRFLLTRIPDGAVAIDTVIGIGPTQDSVDLSLQVPLQAPGEAFTLTITLISASGDTVFRAGPVTVSPSTSGTPATIEATFTYVGLGAAAAGVRVLPSDTSLFSGETVTLVGEAFDSDAVAIPSTPVGWESLDTLVATVNRDVQYRGVVTAGTQRGTARVVATLPTGQADTAVVMVQPLPSAITADSGDAQVGAPGSVLPQRLVARVTASDGLGVAGVWIHFTVTAGGGSLEADSVLTDSTGRAGVTLTLGPDGPQSVAASTPRLGSATATFTATSVTPHATTLTIASGNGQSGTVGTALAPLVVLATDDQDAPFAGDTVVWTVTLGNGTVVPDTVVTDGAGHASTVFTLGTVAGAQWVTARLIGSTAPEGIVTFDAAAAPDAAQHLAFTVEPATTLAGSVITPPVQVTAYDQYANVDTAFTGQVGLAILANPSSGMLSGTPAVNASAGVATFADLIIDMPGAGYTVEASASGLTPDTSAAFDITAGVGKVVWTNPAGGNWSVGTNWSSGAPPTSADTAVITLAGTYAVTVNATATVAHLIVGAASGSQTLVVTNTLTTSTGGELGPNANLQVSAGSYAGAGLTSIAGAFVWTGGTLSGPGTTRVESSGTLSLTTNTHTLDTRTLQLAGTGTWTGGTLSGSNGAVLSIEPGAVLDIQNDVSFSSAGGTQPLLGNQGTLRRSTTSGNVYLDWLLSGAGRVEVLSGTLQLRGGGTLQGIDSVAAGATLLLNGGTFAPSGTYAVRGPGTVQLASGTLTITAPDTVFADTFLQTSGTLAGTGTLVAQTSLTWSGGTQTGTGVTFVPDTATLSLTTNTHALDARMLDLAGTGTWTGGTLSGSNAATLIIEPGAVLDIQNDLAFSVGGGAIPTLDNQGTLRRSTTAGNAYLDWGTTVTGTLEVLSGTLQARGAFGLMTGAILDGSGTLGLSSATVTAFDGTVNPGTSPGLLTIVAPSGLALGANAVVNIEIGGPTTPGTDFDQLKVTNQLLAVGGTLNVSFINAYTPAGGEEFPIIAGAQGSFATVNLPVGLAFDTLTRNDTLFYLEPGAPGPGVIQWTNAGGGGWSAPGNWDLGRAPIAGDTVEILTAGTYTVALDTTAQVAQLFLGGPGATPTLDFGSNSSLAIDDTAAVAAGATLQVNDLSTLTGAGTLTVDGAFSWTGGTMSGGGTTVLNSGATVAFSGATKFLDSRTLVNAATIVWTAGNWFFDGTAAGTNQAGATIDMQGDLRMAFNTGGTFLNLGTLVKSAGSGAGGLDMPFTNDGTVDVQAGNLGVSSIGGSLTHGGAFTGGAGTTLTLSNANPNNQTFNGPITGFAHLAMPNSSGGFTFNGAVTVSHIAIGSVAGVFNGTLSGLDSVTIGGGGSTFQLNTGATVSIPYLVLGANAGAVSGTDDITISDSLVWSYGGFSTSGTVTLGPSAIARIVTLGVSKSSSGPVVNDGTVFLSGSPVTFAGGITNAASATFDIQDDVSLSGPFVNQGTLTKSAGSGVAAMSGSLQNDSVLAITSGTLSLSAGFTQSTTGVLQGTGTLDLSAATVSALDGTVRPGTSPGLLTINGAATLGPNAVVEIELAGSATPGTDFDQLRATNGPLTLGGALAVTLVNPYTPSGGERWPVVVGRAGDFATVNLPAIQPALDTVTSNDTLYVVTAPAGPGVNQWQNAGGGLWSDDASWSLGRAPVAGDTVEILTAGTYKVTLDVDASVDSIAIGGSAGAQTLDASGTRTLTLTKSGSINASGAIDLQSGDLTVTGGNVLTINGGLLHLTSGRTLTLGTGDASELTYLGGTIRGPGILNLTSDAQLNVRSDLTLDSLSVLVNDGAINTGGTQRLTIGPNALMSMVSSVGVNVNLPVINQGALTATGTQTYLNDSLYNQAASLLILDGTSGQAVLYANGIDNSGTISLSGNNQTSLQVTGPGGLTNRTGGAVATQPGATRLLSATLLNEVGGTVAVSATTQITRASAQHVNAGTIDILAGTLLFAQSGTSPSLTNQGSILVGPGTSLTVSGGTFTNDVAGTLSGSGTVNVSATAFTNAGTLAPGLSPGALTWFGNIAMTSTSQLAIELGGTTVGTEYDRLSAGGYTVTVAGGLDVALVNGYTPVVGDSLTIMTWGAQTGGFASVSLPTVSGVALDTGSTATEFYIVAHALSTPIVFAGDSAGDPTNSGVFRVDGDGTNQVHLTSDGAPGQTDVHPRWSPDRSRVTYTTRPLQGNPNQVYVRTADGQQVAIVVTDTSGARPRYSPDGKHLAFACGDGNFPTTAQDVCVIADITNPVNGMGDGAGKRFVTDAVDGTLGGSGAFAWNPQNANQLAVVRDSVFGGQVFGSVIWLVNYDGSGRTPLGTTILDVAGNPVQVYSMDWSPDGTFLAFEGRSALGSFIYRIDVATGTVTPLTLQSLGDHVPVISPDNSTVLFGRDNDQWVLMQIPATGGTETQMTPNFNFGFDQAGWDWSPDGSEVVLTEDYTTGGVVISKILSTTDSNGFPTEVKQVGRRASSEIQDRQPSWRP